MPSPACRAPLLSLKGHSFGAAFTAAAAGLPEWLIKILGRWSSLQRVLFSAASRMASLPVHFYPLEFFSFV